MSLKHQIIFSKGSLSNRTLSIKFLMDSGLKNVEEEHLSIRGLRNEFEFIQGFFTETKFFKNWSIVSLNVRFSGKLKHVQV